MRLLEPRKEVLLTPDGFLVDSSAWNTNLAEELARGNGIGPLTPDHWRVIDFVRNYYLRNGLGPAICRVHRATGFSLKRLLELFPCGLVRGAYRLAGLPCPPGCA